MKVYHLRKKQHLPISVEEAWSFFSNPKQLSGLTPAWMHFEILSQPDSSLYPGMITTYRLRPFPGIRMNCMTEITHVKERELFVDEQRLGPYRFWHHEHHFAEIDGGVELTDIVHYVMPYGILGKIVHQFSVEKKIQKVFRFRYETLENMFGKM